VLTVSSGPDPHEVQHAKELCEDLLANVKDQYQRHKENPPQRTYGGGYGERQNSSGYGGNTAGGYGGYSNSYGGYGGYGGQGSPATLQSPTHPPGVAPGMAANGASSQSTDYTAQWQQYFAQNPQAYYYYQQQATQQSQPQQHVPGASSDAPPPPPPPGGSPGATYNSAPPPPPPAM
jgi:hypothetical protein